MEETTDWRKKDLLPAFDGQRWAMWTRKGLVRADDFEVRNKLKRWHPQSPLLIAAPATTRFCSPIMMPAMADIARKAVRRNMMQTTVPFFLFALGLVGWWLMTGDQSKLGWSVAWTVLGLTFLYDYKVSFASNEGVDERVRFIYWVTNQRAAIVGLLFWVAIMTCAGIFQIQASQESGGLVQTFHAIGVMYPEVRSGEYWRLLTGPWLHYSALHFAANLMLLILISQVTWTVLGPVVSVSAFVIGNVFGAWAQMTFGAQLLDNTGGVSCGIYALCGALAGAGFANRLLLPRGFAVMFAAVSLVAIVASEVTSDRAATTGHLSGFGMGIVLGAIIFGVWKARAS